MALITSAAEAQRQQPVSAVGGSSSNKTGEFSDALDKAFSAISEDMDSIFEEAAALFDLPVNLLKAVAKTESGFNAGAVSGAGAMGVMQLMPQTAKSLGVSDPFDARQNIMGGAKYLRSVLDQFGDVSLALAAYNAGPGNVRKYGGIPPFAETQNYVKKVTSYMDDDSLMAGRSVLTGGATSSIASEMAALSQLNQMASALGGDTLSGIAGLGSYGSIGSLAGSDGSDSLMGFGGYGGFSNLLGLGSGNGLNGMLGGLATVMGASGYGNNDSYGMDQESFSSLVQMMRIQMMMQADRAAGFLET